MGDQAFYGVARAINDVAAKAYLEGWKAGARDALRMANGLPISDGPPYMGPDTPPEFRQWVKDSLARLEGSE